MNGCLWTQAWLQNMVLEDSRPQILEDSRPQIEGKLPFYSVGDNSIPLLLFSGNHDNHKN